MSEYRIVLFGSHHSKIGDQKYTIGDGDDHDAAIGRVVRRNLDLESVKGVKFEVATSSLESDTSQRDDDNA